jgi:hypothetical protein
VLAHEEIGTVSALQAGNPIVKARLLLADE